jgi:hypothetical protein
MDGPKTTHLVATGLKGTAGQGTPVAHWRHCAHAISKILVALPMRVSLGITIIDAISLAL